MPKTKRSVTPKSTRPRAPGYGFPETTKGLLLWSWAEQRLKKSHNYWVTTVKPDSSPHTMVVWGLWQDGRFLFSTVPNRMVQFIRRSPRFTVLMQDLFAGTQPYLGLKSRLLKNLNGTMQEVIMNFFLHKLIPQEDTV